MEINPLTLAMFDMLQYHKTIACMYSYVHIEANTKAEGIFTGTYRGKG